MAKLTLTVDSSVATRAKRFAKANGTSVSRMVETYLKSVSANPVIVDEPPVLRALRGTLKGVDPSDYRRHLQKKYK